jgi:hypothetical protein
MAAFTAELVARNILKAALWAKDEKLGPTLSVELPRVGIICLAFRAFHPGDSPWWIDRSYSGGCFSEVFYTLESRSGSVKDSTHI